MCTKFAEKMEEYMQRTNKKMSDIARETGIPYSTVTSYFKEGRQPTYPVIKAVIEKLNINPDWLFLDKGEMLVEDEEQKRESRYIAKFLAREGVDVMNTDVMKELECVFEGVKDSKLRGYILLFMDIFYCNKHSDENSKRALENIDALMGFLKSLRDYFLIKRTEVCKGDSKD